MRSRWAFGTSMLPVLLPPRQSVFPPLTGVWRATYKRHRMADFQLGGPEPLTLEVLAEVAVAGRKVRLHKDARARIDAARAVVDRIQQGGDAAPAVYGVNTGFGFLADVRISAEAIRDLQRNLIRSHAAGVGAPLPIPVVRAMVLLRAQVLSLGHSGVRAVVCDLLCEMLNRGV